LGLPPYCCHALTGLVPKHGGSSLPLDPSFPSAETAVCDATHHSSASLMASHCHSSPMEPNAGYAIGIAPHCSFASLVVSPHRPPPTDPKGVQTVCLPKIVLALLNNHLAHSISFLDARTCPHTSLLVADTGATHHMIPNKSSFISYYPVSGRCVCMGNNSFAPILGHGSAIISLNRKLILIWHCLHVSDLCNPPYSLYTHHCQQGCGYIGMNGLGMYVFFP
jgi:hypothetical protein